LPLVPDESADQPLVARLRAVIVAKDEQIAGLQAQVEAVLSRLEAAAGRERRLELRVAELERRLSMDSSDSGIPSSKEPIGAREARKARAESQRERRKDRKRGGQPAHQGKGPQRDPDPDEHKIVEPPGQCRSCHAGLDGADPVGARWAQVIDVEIVGKVIEYLLPGLACGGCGTTTFASPPPGLSQGCVTFGPVLNAAAVLLSCYGNVPCERSAQLIGMLCGQDVSAGWVDKADETPVNVLDKTPVPVGGPAGQADPGGGKEASAGAPHVLVVTTPDGRLRLMRALASRRKASVGAGIPAGFTGCLMVDGYTGYQHLLDRIAGIQQCCAHIVRRCRAVQKLGPGGVQNWAGEIVGVLRDAHRAVVEACARGSTGLREQVAQDLRRRYDTAVTSGMIHNRLRDWDTGNHPGYALACWLAEYKEQVLLFTCDFAVDWTNNVSERGVKAAKRHQAVSGYWHSLATLARWCRIRSYLDSAAAHGTAALDAVRGVIEGKPWLPPLPVVS
jgi:transposase